MTHANSSTESLLYTSDESHLHGHSQQTSEESALYGEHLSESKTAPCASSDVPWPSSTLASQAQTQFLPCQPSNASTGSTSMLLPSKGFFSEFATQHARFQESWPTQSSSLPSSSTVFPSSSDALTHQREDPERNFSRASQLRRVGSSHTSGEKSITSTSPHVSHSNYNMRALELPTFRSEREDTYYHTREDSSVSSSSASESISSASLIKQGKHDDGRPKRPLNAFMIFSKARRVALGKERPTLKGKDVSVALAEEWKNLEKVCNFNKMIL